MPRGGLQTALKVTAGFLIGLALWWGASDVYARLLAPPAQAILRASERPPVTRLRASGTEVIVDRSDFPARSARPGVPANDLTFNFIILLALFASNRPLSSNRNVSMLLVAVLLLVITHVLALVVAVKSIYAVQLGAWSVANYGPFSRNFWSGAAHFYRLVGMYGIAFLLWWMLRPAAAGAAPVPSRRGNRKKRKR